MSSLEPCCASSLELNDDVARAKLSLFRSSQMMMSLEPSLSPSAYFEEIRDVECTFTIRPESTN
jgi:hypothetical protein